ncbi:flagellar hook-associated family protein [Aureimonas populi]|uniref:Flagellin n=1 Tax=Aureimonas populi TaxID=1701758 RepID=A0ABW5CJV3_9HYPH|nr:flagellar hook-associated family protein [Aureimonas populi]
MSISTISFNNAARAQIMRVESQLRDALVETSTNRHADVGRTLGRQTANAVSLRSQETSLDRLLQSNKLVTQRLTLADDTLETVATTAEGLQNQLITGLGNDDFLNSARQVAANALDQLIGSANLSVGGQYIFAGTNTDVRPLNGYDAPRVGEDGTSLPSPKTVAQTHFDDFVAAATDGGGVSALAAGDLEAYFSQAGYTDGEGNNHRFDDLFSDPRWNEVWSNASDDTIESRISKSETIDSSVSSNGAAFRDLMAGYVMLDLASGDMGEGARAALSAAAQGRISGGFSGVTAIRSDLGNRISRVEAADESLKQQKDIVAASLGALEDVDMVEAANRVAALQTQLEASYRVTSLIREINILDYL